MHRDVQIKGGAGEVEATVIAAVLDRIAREEAAARQGLGGHDRRLSAWVRAIMPDEPQAPREIVWPD